MADSRTIVLGLTGGIASGKSLCLQYFERLGAKTISSDDIVDSLLKNNAQVIASIKRQMPAAVKNGRVDKTQLAKIVFNNFKQKIALENILHPLVRQTNLNFIQKCENQGVKLVVLEIPLLFETGGEEICDLTVVTDASLNFRLAKIRQRKKYDDQVIKNLIAGQMPQKEKLQMADFVVKTGLSKRFVFSQIAAIVAQCKEKLS